MCILIFAFRGCYYLAHLYCKICFSLRLFAFEGLNTKLSVNVFLAWYIVNTRPALIKTVCKHSVDCCHGFHIICPRTSFSWDVVALPRERYTFLSKYFYVYRSYLIELMFLELRRFIPPFCRSATTLIDHCRVYFVYIFIERVTMVSRDPLNQLRRTKEQPYARAN